MNSSNGPMDSILTSKLLQHSVCAFKNKNMHTSCTVYRSRFIYRRFASFLTGSAMQKHSLATRFFYVISFQFQIYLNVAALSIVLSS